MTRPNGMTCVVATGEFWRDMPEALQQQRLEQMLSARNNARRYARVWEALAHARELSRERPDCIELRTRQYKQADSGCTVEVDVRYRWHDRQPCIK